MFSLLAPLFRQTWCACRRRRTTPATDACPEVVPSKLKQPYLDVSKLKQPYVDVTACHADPALGGYERLQSEAQAESSHRTIGIKPLLCAVAFWSFVGLSCCMCIVIIIITLPFFGIYDIISRSLWGKPKIRDLSIFELERSLVTLRLPDSQGLDDVNINVCVHGVNLNVHAFFRAAQDSELQRPMVVLLHGVNMTAASFIQVVDKLSTEHDLLVLDWPGNGRSDGARHLADWSAQACIAFYVDTLEAFLQAYVGDKRVYIVGHSWGAYLAANHAIRYPQRLDRLFLQACVGILPTLGVKGAYYAFLFRHVFPKLPVCGAPALKWYVSVAMHLLGASAEDWYSLSFLSSPDNILPQVVARCISLSWTSAFWNEPIWSSLERLSKGGPVALSYGQVDDIIPAHQGDLAHSVYGYKTLTLLGAGHTISKHGVEFAELVLDWGRPSCPSRCKPKRARVISQRHCRATCPNARHSSTFSTHDTGLMIAKYYQAVLCCDLPKLKNGCGDDQRFEYREPIAKTGVHRCDSYKLSAFSLMRGTFVGVSGGN